MCARSLVKLIKCLKFARNNLIFVVISVIHTDILAIMYCSLCKHTSSIFWPNCVHIYSAKQSKAYTTHPLIQKVICLYIK